MELILAMQTSLQLGGILKPLLALALVGFLVWAIVTYIPMPDIFKKAIIVVAVVVVIVWLAQTLGVW